MRIHRICLFTLMVAALALSVQAGDNKEGNEDKEHRAKLIHGQVTAVSISGETVSWTLKIEDGDDKTLSMPAAVNAIVREGKITHLVVGTTAPRETPKEPAKLASGKVTAASVDGEVVKLTITTADGAVEGQMPTHVMVKLDKDGNVHAIRGAPAHKEHRTEKKEKVQ